ncbi:hypothetical protein [Nonomuraea typhae]|uniref:hypothetical protein n=1 Tax=Nonomuraea typhae TaxID=2603600 RepID=UPI0012FA5AC5|nr:hypothetical protein [Nonomuraea typhae]
MDLPLLIVLVALLMVITTLVVFVVVVIAIRSEDHRRRLDGTDPTHAERMTRRLVGAYSHHCTRSQQPSARKGGDCR